MSIPLDQAHDLLRELRGDDFCPTRSNQPTWGIQ